LDRDSGHYYHIDHLMGPVLAKGRNDKKEVLAAANAATNQPNHVESGLDKLMNSSVTNPNVLAKSLAIALVLAVVGVLMMASRLTRLCPKSGVCPKT